MHIAYMYMYIIPLVQLYPHAGERPQGRGPPRRRWLPRGSRSSRATGQSNIMQHENDHLWLDIITGFLNYNRVV